MGVLTGPKTWEGVAAVEFSEGVLGDGEHWIWKYNEHGWRWFNVGEGEEDGGRGCQGFGGRGAGRVYLFIYYLL
jgi:hypothetical protein